jgi:hypothetical protein
MKQIFKWATAKENRLPVVFLVFLGYLVVAIAYSIVFPPTPAQQRTTEAQQQAQDIASAQSAKNEQAKEQSRAFTCQLKRICTQYAAARQDCAVAANFDRCIQIKMGREDRLYFACTNDGKLYFSNSDEPGTFECFITDLLAPP